MTDLAAWGIDPGYRDYRKQWHDAPEQTLRSLLEAMGADGRPAPHPADRVLVVGPGRPGAMEGRWRLETEDGGEVNGEGHLPPDLAPGYHRLWLRDGQGQSGEAVRLVVSPGRCYLPEGLRTWGWAVQLHSARSRRSWGIGDLSDLRVLGEWAARQGAGVALLNPLHASLPVPEQQASPYFPSSRCYRSPLYLDVEAVPGAASSGADLEELAARARALNDDRRIDRDAAWAHKLSALERIWEGFRGDGGFDRYRASEGEALAGYATFCALVERHGPGWDSWPEGLRRPDGAGIAAFARQHADRVRFHQWVQWLLDRQLGDAGAALPLLHDVAIGVDPAGADAWLWQDAFAPGVRVGAPPDEFNTLGQDWGLPPFDPWRLRAAGYEPFVRTVRGCFRHAGGIRVDHVMGLFRLFWIPAGAGPGDGTYVRYPAADLLDIVALESWRAGAYVVGEDLGTVEDEVRAELAERRVLSYRLVWFEEEPPGSFPHQSLAAVTTHDLPTVAGLWSGADLEEQERLDLAPNAGATEGIRRRLGKWAGLDPSAPVDEAVVAAHRLLAEAPSAVVVATLEDAMAVVERPNVPGTTDERPNWSLALPRPIEELEADALATAIAGALAGRGERRRDEAGP